MLPASGKGPGGPFNPCNQARERDPAVPSQPNPMGLVEGELFSSDKLETPVQIWAAPYSYIIINRKSYVRQCIPYNVFYVLISSRIFSTHPAKRKYLFFSPILNLVMYRGRARFLICLLLLVNFSFSVMFIDDCATLDIDNE